MSVQTYIYSKVGNIKLSEGILNISLGEWKTPSGYSGHDTVLIDADIIPAMRAHAENLYKWFGKKAKTIRINAGHRTPARDIAVGGSGAGPHTKGKAIDFCYLDENGKYINQEYLLCTGQLMGIQGIERILCSVKASVHFDVNYRGVKANGTPIYWRTRQAKNAAGKFVYIDVPDFFNTPEAKALGITLPANFKPVVPQPSEGWVLKLQKALNAIPVSPKLVEDNAAGSRTLAACPPLKKGSTHKALISLVQERIGATANGVWDDAFNAKFVAWQKANPVVGIADGICGQGCWKRLLGLS